MATSRSQVLALYRSLLREAKKFTDYNYRMYALRRTKDCFHENKTVSDPVKIDSLLEEATRTRDMIKRQVIVGQMYGHGKLVIEKSRP